MAEFIARWFTPSKSDQGAPIPQPAVAPSPKTEMASADANAAKAAKKKTISKFGGVQKQTPLLAQDEAQLAKKVLLGQ